MNPENLLYSRDHEWILAEDGKARVGITFHAQEALGDVVFVELPAEGDHFQSGESFGTVESVKAVSDCFAPVSGTIRAVNENLLASPELLNQDPYGDGWLVEIELDESELPGDLMTSAAYDEFLSREEA